MKKIGKCTCDIDLICYMWVYSKISWRTNPRLILVHKLHNNIFHHFESDRDVSYNTAVSSNYRVVPRGLKIFCTTLYKVSKILNNNNIKIIVIMF